MKITVSNEQNNLIISVDVSQSMTLEDFKAYLQAETDIEPEEQILVCNSKSVSGDKQTLDQLGLKDDDLVILKKKTVSAPTTATTANTTNSMDSTVVDNQIEAMRQQFLTNPSAANQLRATNPTLHDAINDPPQFSSLMKQALQQMQNGQIPSHYDLSNQQEIRRLEQDPDNPENQARILELIRQEQIEKNMELAYDLTPESFVSVSMLYIKIKVNGKPVQAFVDSGAQQTIISPRLAERVGIDRLIDRRFVGEARGVGSTKILGKIHSVPISIGDSDFELPCSFHVIETSVDLLFGLDMLKRHKCLIDLANNKLVVGGHIETPFLQDHEIENNDLLGNTVGGNNSNLGFGGNIFSDATIPINDRKKPASQAAQAAAKRQNVGSSSGPSTGPSTSSTSGTTSSYKEEDIQQLVGLGFSKAQAIQALDACQGNVEMAASLLFQ